MGIRRGTAMRAALAAVVMLAMVGEAGAGTDGLVLRAAGFFEAEASDDGKCQIPTVDSGIPVSSDEIGLWNTLGFPTVSYPLTRCGGWMEVVNMMTRQGISIDNVELKMRIAGAGRFRQFVPTRNGFPTACRSLRKVQVFSGAHLFPFGFTPDGTGNTGSGAPHVAFVNLFPMVNAQIIHCLRAQYAALPSDVYVSFPLIIRAVATGVADDGTSFRSNPIQFTLTLDHLCGNGRIDNAEVCDPNAPNTCLAGTCDTASGACSVVKSIPCSSNADCIGTCLPQGDLMECNCVY